MTKKFAITHNFLNFSEFSDGQLHYGDEEMYFDSYWKISIQHTEPRQLETSFLNCALKCRIPCQESTKSSIKTNVRFRIFSDSGSIETESENFKFNKQNSLLEVSPIRWPTQKVLVEVCVEILESIGVAEPPESQRDPNEVTVIVENTKFYFSKLYLAVKFKYFEYILLGENNEDEFTLSKVILDDFLNLLVVLDGYPIIDDTNVINILNVADEYEVDIVKRKCTYFLINKSHKSRDELKEIAVDYDLIELKYHLVITRPQLSVSDCLECKVCYEVFQETPKTLQCGHSFCTACIKKLTQSNCPICCQVVNLQSAIPNYGLKNVMDRVNERLEIILPRKMIKHIPLKAPDCQLCPRLKSNLKSQKVNEYLSLFVQMPLATACLFFFVIALASLREWYKCSRSLQNALNHQLVNNPFVSLGFLIGCAIGTVFGTLFRDEIIRAYLNPRPRRRTLFGFRFG